MRIVIVGGGITGLSAAYQVVRSRPDAEVVLLESRARLGGNIVTDYRDEFVIDGGPDSFLATKPDALTLCAELGLTGELISPTDEARNVYMVHRGRLEKMPAGMVLAVPTRIGPMLKTPILSPLAKARVLGDLLVRSRAGREDESIADFIARHFGRETAERIAAPLLGGIYAGNISELSIAATFPQLLELERKHGSVIRGFFRAQLGAAHAAGVNGHGPLGRARELAHLASWLRREEQHRQSPFRSFRNGMRTLIDALAAKLAPGAVQLSSAVSGIVCESDGRFRVHVHDKPDIVADAVILAAPAHAAAHMVDDRELSSELSSIRYESTATVFLALKRAGIQHTLDASGFIAAPHQAKILAGTWVSSKWEHRAPADSVLMRAFVGGARDPRRVVESSDDDLIQLAHSELETLMGSLGKPLFARVYRYENSSPQPVLGHCGRLERIERRLQRTPGLYIAGAAYDGVGIPDCIRQGRAAGERAVREKAPA